MCVCIYIYIYKTRLASNEVFSPSNKLHREVGWAKDLPAPWIDYIIYIYFILIYVFFSLGNSPYWAWASSLSTLHDHTQTHHTQ